MREIKSFLVKTKVGEYVSKGDLLSLNFKGEVIKFDPKKKGIIKVSRKHRKKRSSEIWNPKKMVALFKGKETSLLYDEIKIVGTSVPSFLYPEVTTRSKLIKRFFTEYPPPLPLSLDQEDLLNKIVERSNVMKKHIGLYREPLNPHDKNAVSVRIKIIGGEPFYDVGYIPAYISKEILKYQMYLTSIVPDGRGMKIGVFFSSFFLDSLRGLSKITCDQLENKKSYKPKTLRQIRKELGEN